MQAETSEEFLVPSIYYLKKGRNKSIVETFCIWSESVPYVLPKVDFVLILKTNEESGLIRYENILKTFGQSFSVGNDKRINSHSWLSLLPLFLL
ncbi:MAG: hypothetical protein ACI9XO_003140 [Paraglaciecola sp.]